MERRATGLVKRALRLSDPSDGLAAVAELRREVEALEAAQVRHAVAEGWSWRRIAEALGVSKQAAHKKHGAPRASQARGEEGQRLVITGQARDVVEHAREEAAKAGDKAVEPQHLLLGLLRSGGGPAWAALRAAGVDLEAARREVQAGRNREVDTDEHALPRSRLPVSPAARAGFEQSLREAVARGDDHLGVEHVLLALLGDDEGAAARTLGRLGVPLGRLHRLLERASTDDASARSRGSA